VRVKLARDARSELSDILQYIQDINPAGAWHVLQAVDDTLDLIGRHPEIGPPTSRRGVRVKLVAGYPYKIFYRIRPDHIEVAHIRHAARRPWLV
jgi:toxin ParE1/3/4